jgi:hypothetical protein
MNARIVLVCFAVSLASCSTPDAAPDGGFLVDATFLDGTTPSDATAEDAGATDAGATDAGATDAGATDAGGRDDAGEPGTSCDGPGVSRGMPGSADLDRLPDGATRFFYAGPDELSSVRCNAIDDPQTLYYDVYTPAGSSDATVLYLHGGGYNVGNANFEPIADACRQLTALGTHCVSIEYRRGFTLDPSAVSGMDLTAEDAGRFREILEMARFDVLEAWDHLDAQAAALELPRRYVVVGESAGGSLASRVTLTNLARRHSILGTIIGFGTHEATEALAPEIDFPVVLQGGLLDGIQPAFENHIWFDDDMPIAKGLFDLAEELRDAGVPTRVYVNGQQGHGFGSYQSEDGTIEHYVEALAFFRAIARRQPADEFVEWRFQHDDCEAGIIAGTTRVPGTRYDPRQADLETGLSPADVGLLRGSPRPCR